MTTPAPTSGCLFTTFKNISGVEMTFGFLPPHGRTLAADEELSVHGSPVEAVIRTNYRAAKRNLDALASALRDETLDIIKTPCAVVYDDGDAASYALGSSSGSVAPAAPDWGGEDESSSA